MECTRTDCETVHTALGHPMKRDSENATWPLDITEKVTSEANIHGRDNRTTATSKACLPVRAESTQATACRVIFEPYHAARL